MARLSIRFCAIAMGAFHLSVFPGGNAHAGNPVQLGLNASIQQESVVQSAVNRLNKLLAAPLETDGNWRRRVWVELRRLEHDHTEIALQGWEVLAESSSDQDRANLLLFQRRHSLPLMEVPEFEGPEATLERCLSLWGQGLIAATHQALIAAVEQFPDDERFADNLRWLNLSPPKSLPLDGRPRDFALAVLAARNAHY